MAQANLYELALSPEDQAAIDAAIDTLVTRLGPHLKNLTTDERKELPKMGDKSVAFVEKAREDSRMLAGSEAYQAALMVDHNAKMGASAGIPNAKAVYEDLAARFPGGTRKRGTQPTQA